MKKNKGKPVKAVSAKPEPVTLKQEATGKLFETTDCVLAGKLEGKGFKLKEVLSPSVSRKEALFIFHETEEKIREVANG